MRRFKKKQRPTPETLTSQTTSASTPDQTEARAVRFAATLAGFLLCWWFSVLIYYYVRVDPPNGPYDPLQLVGRYANAQDNGFYLPAHPEAGGDYVEAHLHMTRRDPIHTPFRGYGGRLSAVRLCADAAFRGDADCCRVLGFSGHFCRRIGIGVRATALAGQAASHGSRC